MLFPFLIGIKHISMITDENIIWLCRSISSPNFHPVYQFGYYFEGIQANLLLDTKYVLVYDAISAYLLIINRTQNFELKDGTLYNSLTSLFGFLLNRNPRIRNLHIGKTNKKRQFFQYGSPLNFS